MKKTLFVAGLIALMFAACTQKSENNSNADNNQNELKLTEEWDKIFPKSEKVDHKKVTFKNRFGITLVADMYTPKDAADKKLPAIAVSGPFGAVKEQVSGLYAQHMAERGFLTIAFDASYTGESTGEPRNTASPDVNTEDFSAAVDFLTTLPNVDADRIGLIGICGFGGMALNTAAMDTRVKATVTSTMYDMSRVNANGYFDDDDNAEARLAKRQAYNTIRTSDALGDSIERQKPLPDSLKGDEPQFVKDYYDFYKTPRGYHPRGICSNGAWDARMTASFMTMPLNIYASEIRSAVLIIHGEKAHSAYFSKDLFKRLTGTNKELLIIPGAVHTDLYDDKAGIIPYDKMEAFFRENLK